MSIGNLVLFHQRVRPEEEHWFLCRKCQGIFFGDNPGSVCPKGGSHENTKSQNYHIPLT